MPRPGLRVLQRLARRLAAARVRERANPIFTGTPSKARLCKAHNDLRRQTGFGGLRCENLPCYLKQLGVYYLNGKQRDEATQRVDLITRQTR
jgi:hypothetical protein